MEENFLKGFIRPFILLVGYPIFFVRKKDRLLRLYINYWQLNNIIIKNKYALPLLKNLIE